MQDIPDFFEGKNIFVTGASGFVGKALVEKLLRSCPKIGNIYVLLRNNGNKSVRERIERIVNNPLFDLLKQEQPDALKKIIPMIGNITEENLGLNEEQIDFITKNVHIIYNCAASVRFNDTLHEAILTNVKSTQEICHLAFKCRQLKVLVHVSTTYCNTDRDHVEETVYPIELDWRTAIKMVEQGEFIIGSLSSKCIHPLPNTYSFTKRLAENVVLDLCKDTIPLVIVRPSIVVYAKHEPIPGWLGNLNGPFALVTAFLKGVTDIGYFNTETILNGVFVDNLVKAMIIAAWKKCQSSNNNQLDVDVYNASSDLCWPISNFIKVSSHALWNYPHTDRLWVYDRMRMTKNWWIFYLSIVFRHALFAVFVDCILKLIGKQPRLLPVIRKVYVGNLSVVYFMERTFYFKNDNYRALEKCISDNDKENFKYYGLTEKDDIFEVTRISVCGVKRFIFREPYPIQEQTFRNTKTLFVLHVVERLLVLGIIIYLLFWRYIIN